VQREPQISRTRAAAQVLIKVSTAASVNLFFYDLPFGPKPEIFLTFGVLVTAR
jgi:hypothetical protein